MKAVFILSAKHSGSTWLNLVLGSHSWAANVGEFWRPFSIPGHTACRLCEARGLEHCEILGDVSGVPKQAAIRHAAEKFGVNTIIDSSKRFDWVQTFQDQPDHEIFVIHLIRHPCGYLASRLRRDKNETPEGAFEEWVNANREIHDFASRFGKNAICISYEDLALKTEASFEKLTAFLGEQFEPSALRYWEFAHHGLGGNGANFVYLRDLPEAVYVTGDHAYYENVAGKEHVYDDRWRDELDDQTIEALLKSSAAIEIAAFVGRDFSWLE